MAKTPLRMDDREQIAVAMVARKFDPVAARLDAEEYALAAAVWEHVHGPFKAVIYQLPKGALRADHELDLNYNGRWLSLKFGPDPGWDKRDTRETRPMFASCNERLVPSKKLAERLDAWSDGVKQLQEDKTDALAKTLGTLKSFRTFEDLIAAWPEAAKFVTSRMTKRDIAPNVPAVLLRDLNALLDLPPETELAL